MVDGGNVCAACGMAAGPIDPRPKPLAKVVPFKSKRRPHERPPQGKPPRRRASAVTWWIVAIIAICLLLPYVRL